MTKVRIRPDARPYGVQAIDELVGLVEDVELRFHPSLPEHARRIMATLGVRVVLDERAPTHCCFKPTGFKPLTRTQRRARGLHVYDPPDF